MPKRGVPLKPGLYDRLQQYVHRGHYDTRDVIAGMLGLSPGETVIEIGCGTGAVGRRFLDKGYDYWGIDPDADRVKAARSKHGDHFLVGDVSTLGQLGLPDDSHFFIHGVLHHVDDAIARSIVDVLLAGCRGVVVVSEPIRPDAWWRNPLGALAARLDDGAWMRTLDEWLELFGDDVAEVRVRRLWPRWPVSMLDVQLRAGRSGGPGDPGAEAIPCG